MANSIKTLHKAKKEKNDEFYTQRIDVENELVYYKSHFKDKIVLCNCDDESSAFWEYFHLLFGALGLKKLIATHYDKEKPTYKVEYCGGNDNDVSFCTTTPLISNGDFRNQECIDLLKEADIVVTNPPFSLFREYLAQLIEYDKKFLIIGNQNAIVCKEIFPLFKYDKIWLGASAHKSMTFKIPNNAPKRDNQIEKDGIRYQSLGNICWFTNLDHNKRHQELKLYATYDPKEYPKYDNFDAINVDKTDKIPDNYIGIMGVPISFIDKYCPDQFEIVWQASGNTKACCPKHILDNQLKYKQSDEDRGGCGVINGKRLYTRIFIKRK